MNNDPWVLLSYHVERMFWLTMGHFDDLLRSCDA